eukprot:scaffold2806_cov135-Isochrysis_galbana.AAC.1
MARPGLRLLLQVGHTMEEVELAHVARLVKIAVDARGLHDEGAAGEKRLFQELAEIVRLVHRERAQIVAQGLQEAALVLDTSRARDAATPLAPLKPNALGRRGSPPRSSASAGITLAPLLL